jgi:hypothetical protein
MFLSITSYAVMIWPQSPTIGNIRPCLKGINKKSIVHEDYIRFLESTQCFEGLLKRQEDFQWVEQKFSAYT